MMSTQISHSNHAAQPLATRCSLVAGRVCGQLVAARICGLIAAAWRVLQLLWMAVFELEVEMLENAYLQAVTQGS